MSDLYWLTDDQMARLRPYCFKSNGNPGLTIGGYWRHHTRHETEKGRINSSDVPR